MSETHKQNKENARDMLMMILSSIRFLARQGLAFRKVKGGVPLLPRKKN